MTNETFSLTGKNAVVTGAGTGIGRAIALAFAEAGAQVACVDLEREGRRGNGAPGPRARTAWRSRCAAMSAAKTT